MATYEEKMAELRKKYGLAGAAPATTPTTAAPTSQATKGATFEERSAAIKQKWGVQSKGAPSASTAPTSPSATQAPSPAVNFAPMDEHQISAVAPAPVAPTLPAAPIQPMQQRKVDRLLTEEAGIAPSPATTRAPGEPTDMFSLLAPPGRPISAPAPGPVPSEPMGNFSLLAPSGMAPSPAEVAQATAQETQRTAEKATREYQDRLQATKADPSRLATAIVEGRIRPRDLADITPDKFDWTALEGATYQSQFTGAPTPGTGGIRRIAEQAKSDPATAHQNLMNFLQSREEGKLFQFLRGIREGGTDALTLGYVPQDTIPETTAEKAGNLTGAVLGQLPWIAGAAATGGAAAGAVGRAAGIVNPLVQAAIQAGGTGATIATAQEAVKGLARPGDFDAGQAARNILSTTAEYAAFGPAYEGLGILGGRIAQRAPGLARAVQAVESVPVVGEAITGGAKGAIAGGGVGVGKAVLGALTTPEGREAKSFVQTVADNAKQELSEELVEAIAFGIVRKFVPMNAGAVLATAQTLQTEVQATAETPAQATAPTAPAAVPAPPSPATQPAATAPTVAAPVTPAPAPQAPALDRANLIRTANPGMDERAIVDMVNTTGNLSDEEFQGFADRAGKPGAAAPANTPTPTPQRDGGSTGLKNLGGQGMVDAMYDMLWDKAQKGDTTEAGAPSAVLQAAKVVRDAGGLQTRDELVAFAKEVQEVRNSGVKGKKYQAGIGAVVAKYTPQVTAPASIAPAPTTQELPTPTGAPVRVPEKPLPTKPQAFGDTVAVGQTVGLPRPGQFEVIETTDKSMVKVREIGKEGSPVFSVGRKALRAPANRAPATEGATQPAATVAEAPASDVEQARQRVVSAGQEINAALDPAMQQVYGSSPEASGQRAVIIGKFTTHVMNGGEVSATALRTALKLPSEAANALNNAYHSSQALRDAIKERGNAITALKPLEDAKRQAPVTPAPATTTPPTKAPKPATAKAEGTQTPLPPEGLSVRTSANYKGEAQRKAAADYGKAIDDWAAQNNHDRQGFQLVRTLFSDGQWRPAIRTTQAGARPGPGWVQLTSERGDSAGAFYAVDHSYQPPAATQQATAPSADTEPTTAPAATIATGSTTTAKTERGTAVETQYALVDAGTLTASHDTALKANPDYPQELQPRDRSRVASEDQINRMVGSLEPSFLGASPKASEGAPIVGPDLVVESGNGRTIALQRAYAQGHKSAETYKTWLADNAKTFGLDPQAVKDATAPVLVRVRQTEVDRADFARQANEQSVAAMSATEQAMSDATKLEGGWMALFNPTESGELVHPGNRDFMRVFMDKVMGPTERGRYLTADGALSQEGINRIRNAVFAKAYGNPMAIEKLAESPDNNVRNITNGMLTAAGRVVQIKDGITDGRLHNLDLSQEIAGAMQKLSELRESGQTVQQFLGQSNLFADELSPLTREILDVFDKHKRSSKKIASILAAYADVVEGAGDPRQVTLFGQVKPTLSEVWESTIRRSEEGSHELQASLFDGQPADGGSGVDAGRPQGGAGAEAQSGSQAQTALGQGNTAQEAPADNSGGVSMPATANSRQSAKERLRQKTAANTADGEGGFLSLGGGPQAGKRAQADPETVTFDDEETEQRWQASKGIKPESFRQKFMQFMTDMGHKFTREFEHLPRTAEHAEFRDKLHKVTKGKGIASDEAIRYLQGITVKMKEGEYDLFVRKVILDDLMEEMDLQQKRLAEDVDAGKQPWEIRLPFGLTEQTLPGEHAKVTAAMEQNATVKQAYEDRRAIAKELVETYVQTAQDAVGFTPPLNRKDYYRHQVLAYAGLKTLKGTGASLKAPTNRGFLKTRTGSAQDINTNYLEAEHEFLSQILYDTQVFKTIQFVKGKYDIEAELKAQAKAEGTHWRNLVPDGYTIWKPDSRSVVYNAWSLPAKYADAIQDKALDEIGVTKSDLRKVKVMGGPREQLVIPEAVAETLNTFGQGPTQDPIRWTVSKWKGLALMGPRRFIKYNLRNISGDLDAAIAGNPAGFKRVPTAVSDLYVYLINGGAPSAELVEWIGRGGLQDTLGVAESVGNINGLALFHNIARQKGVLERMREGDLLAPIKATWAAYGRVTRGATDFREAILRYANYRSYLDQMEKREGRPKNFGASLRDEVMALPDVRDRAYKLSNDLMGAYDEVTVAGQYVRDRLIPFWSWNEVNFRRNTRLIQNAVQDGVGTAAVGRSVAGKLAGVAVRSPLIAYNIGKFALAASAFTGLLAAWNHLVFPDEDKELPDDVKSRPYIIFGRDRDGNVVYFNRLGALHDFLEWFGLADAPQHVRNYLDGSMTIKEIVTAMAMSPVKKLVGGLGIYATPFEVVMGKALYPDPFRPRSIRDRWEHLANFVGFAPEYRELTGKPTRGYGASAMDLVTYRLDPAESAYYEAIGIKYDWLEKKRGATDFSSTSPKSNALYYLKQAIRLGDKDAMEKYMFEYAKFGGTKDGLGKSLETMHPLFSIAKADRKAFMDSLNMRDKETFRKAEEFYKEVLEAGDVKQAPGYKELPRN